MNGAADEALRHRRRRELAPVPVEVLAEPLVDLAERPLLYALVGVRQVAHEPLPDLRREDAAELVRREVPEHAAGPVDVLQAADPVVRRADADELLPPRVPGGRDVGGGEGA